MVSCSDLTMLLTSMLCCMCMGSVVVLCVCVCACKLIFLHGVQEERASEAWVMGRLYLLSAHDLGQRERFDADVRSRLWMSYRRGFAPIGEHRHFYLWASHCCAIVRAPSPLSSLPLHLPTVRSPAAANLCNPPPGWIPLCCRSPHIVRALRWHPLLNRSLGCHVTLCWHPLLNRSLGCPTSRSVGIPC